MKNIIVLSLIIGFLFSCNTGKTTIKSSSDEITTVLNDTIHITNKELEYEIIILEIGFDNWILTQPAMGYYSIDYLERKNRLFVTEYNNRVFLDRTRQLYEQEINYDPNLHYGLEVNYLLFNYFKFFQQRYKQKL